MLEKSKRLVLELAEEKKCAIAVQAEYNTGTVWAEGARIASLTTYRILPELWKDRWAAAGMQATSGGRVKNSMKQGQRI